MNYLAHVRLAEPNPDSWIGNILGDFVKGSLQAYTTQYNIHILRGIQMHRQVDTFTDRHPLFLRSKQRISPEYGRLSGIVMDIFYDHFLIIHWQEFSPEPLDPFIASIYTVLLEQQYLLPVRVQTLLPRLVAQDWLGTNKTTEGVSITLERISHRFSRPNQIATAHHALDHHYAELETDFLAFFPEAIAYTQAILKSSAAESFHPA